MSGDGEKIVIEIPVRETARRLVEALGRTTIRELLLLLLALHLFAMAFPSDGGMVFDERYYVPAGRDLLSLRASNIEHPFLGKLWGALGILVFGDNWFGWRIPSVLFSIAAVWVLYRLGMLFLPERYALAAAAFLGFDTLFFAHGTLYLLEVPTIFFGLLAFYAYFRGRYGWAAVLLGLSILSKEWGVFFAAVLAVYHVSQHHKGLLRREAIARGVKIAIVLMLVVLIPMWIYDTVYSPMAVESVVVQPIVILDDEGRIVGTITTTIIEGYVISNPIEHIQYIAGYVAALRVAPENANPWDNYPWSWILPWGVNPSIYYEQSVKKEVAYVEGGVEVRRETVVSRPIRWTGIGTLPIWYSIWISAPLMLYRIARRRAGGVEWFLLSWILITYLPWIFLSLLAGRIVYAFYFLNTVPALCLAIPWMVRLLPHGDKRRVVVLGLWLLVSVVFFAYYYPVRVWEF